MTLIEHLTLVEETRSDINRKHDLVGKRQATAACCDY